MFRHDPARTAYSSISGPSTPNVLWTFSANDSGIESAPAVVDTQTSMVTWGFLVTQHQINGTNGNNLYVGKFCSLDLSNGTILRTSIIQTNGSINNGADLGLAPGDKVLYLTAGLDLWTIDKASGFATLIQHYEHYTDPIIPSRNMVCIATDLYLSA